jgi:medium-chain acyl-[acyl-carrier-protein] hydrolase
MKATTSSGRWVTCPRPNPNAGLRLFCLPYAGGSAAIYRSWADSLAGPLPNVEVCPVELPGRGGRLLETPIARLGDLVDELALALVPLLDRPYALFGHSMGAWVAFDLARHLRDAHRLPPAHLFVSGQAAPHAARRGRPIHDLPDEAFLEEVRRLGGTPAAVLQNKEMMKLMLPVLRADLTMCGTYRPQPAAPLTCPVSAYGGLNDALILPDAVAAWKQLARGPFRLRMFPGDHFFVQGDRETVLEAVAEDLSPLARRTSREPARTGAGLRASVRSLEFSGQSATCLSA